MGKVLMKLRVMPKDVNVDLRKLIDEIKNIQIEGVEIRDYSEKPIAFGLKALELLAVMPDTEGIGDKFVEEIQKIEDVESVEVESVELL